MIGDYRDSWQTVCKKAKLPGRLVHDLRRSAVRNLIAAGVDEKAAMAVTGHVTRSVFDRYHIVNGADVAEAMAKVSARLQPVTRPAVAAQLRSDAGEAENTRQQWRPERDSNHSNPLTLSMSMNGTTRKRQIRHRRTGWRACPDFCVSPFRVTRAVVLRT